MIELPPSLTATGTILTNTNANSGHGHTASTGGVTSHHHHILEETTTPPVSPPVAGDQGALVNPVLSYKRPTILNFFTERVGTTGLCTALLRQ